MDIRPKLFRLGRFSISDGKCILCWIFMTKQNLEILKEEDIYEENQWQ